MFWNKLPGCRDSGCSGSETYWVPHYWAKLGFSLRWKLQLTPWQGLYREPLRLVSLVSRILPFSTWFKPGKMASNRLYFRVIAVNGQEFTGSLCLVWFNLDCLPAPHLFLREPVDKGPGSVHFQISLFWSLWPRHGFFHHQIKRGLGVLCALHWSFGSSSERLGLFFLSHGWSFNALYPGRTDYN